MIDLDEGTYDLNPRRAPICLGEWLAIIAAWAIVILGAWKAVEWASALLQTAMGGA